MAKDWEEEDIAEGAEGTDELFEHFSLTVDKGQQPLRIDKFLVNRIMNASRNRLQAAMHAGAVLVNGNPIKPNYKVRPLDKVSIVLPQPPRDTELKGENIPLDIIYEDEALLIINKPAGMVVHPGYNNYTGTLVNALVYHFENLPTAGGERRPGLVHRIDKDTSGLLVIAKDEYALTHLAKQFYDHTIDRKYLALAWGSVQNDEGTITGYLARSQRDRRLMHVYSEESQGKWAVTHYRVLERYSYATLVECTLETGRTHQIRIHMKSLGHPLFNDAAYGGAEIVAGPGFTKYKQFIENCFAACPRQALHAYTLGFTHPFTGDRMFFEQPLPPDMAELLERWRRYSPKVNDEG